MKKELEIIIFNVLSGEYYTLWEEHYTVVYISRSLTLYQVSVRDYCYITDSRYVYSVAGLNFIACSYISSEVATKSSLDSAIPESPSLEDVCIEISGHSGRSTETCDCDIVLCQALVLCSLALSRKSCGVVAYDQIDIRISIEYRLTNCY